MAVGRAVRRRTGFRLPYISRSIRRRDRPAENPKLSRFATFRKLISYTSDVGVPMMCAVSHYPARKNVARP